MAVADEFFAGFVQQPESERFQAPEKRDGFHALEHQMRFVASFEIVIRNARAQMVDVMVADVTGKPLENLRQLIKGTALQRGGGVIPLLFARPINAFELVLDVEQPEASRTGDRHRG